MKIKYIILALAGLALVLQACKKEGVNVSITGKWVLLSDSTFADIGPTNHAVNYTGQAGDYFDFRSDNFVYTREGGIFDTLSYQVISNTQIVIQRFGIVANGQPEISNIEKLTAHDLFITAPRAITPAGQFGRKVRLSR